MTLHRAVLQQPAGLAQSAERETLNLKVAGSTPAFGFHFLLFFPFLHGSLVSVGGGNEIFLAVRISSCGYARRRVAPLVPWIGAPLTLDPLGTCSPTPSVPFKRRLCEPCHGVVYSLQCVLADGNNLS
ncbi:hypothetical protein BJY00DRAFT_58075 [Aspergillus carlsbadensis]|nr:hypothetical protein BJY00DRAFT_58075 [Aspergillus carlsbadensis]